MGNTKQKSVEFPVKITNAQVLKTAGSMCYNTDSASTAGVGQVISNGTAWKNIYSGATQ